MLALFLILQRVSRRHSLLFKMESSLFFHSISKTSSTEASSSRSERKRSHIKVGYSAEASEKAYIPEVKVVSDQPDVKPLLDSKGEIADPKSSVTISEQIKSKIDAQNHAVKSEPNDDLVKTENWELNTELEAES